MIRLFVDGIDHSANCNTHYWHMVLLSFGPVAAGKPNKGTRADKRLKENKKKPFPGAKPPYQQK